MSKVNLNYKEIEMLKDENFQELLVEYKGYKGNIQEYSNEALFLMWKYFKPFYSDRLGMFRVVETIAEMQFEETNLSNLRKVHSLESNAFTNKEQFIANLKKSYIVLVSENKGMFSFCSNNIYVVSKINKDGIIRTSRDNKGAK